jgi:hypothetical protein
MHMLGALQAMITHEGPDIGQASVIYVLSWDSCILRHWTWSEIPQNLEGFCM